jgi:AAA domain
MTKDEIAKALGASSHEPSEGMSSYLKGRAQARNEPEVLVVPKGPSIIVIGPDGVGKTTVCAHLSAMTGIPVWKSRIEKRIFKGELSKFADGGSLVFDIQFADLIYQTGCRFISDRGYPCEKVYAQVFGRKTDEGLLTAIDQSHEEVGTKILYLYSSVLPTREDDLVPSAKYWDVKAAYDKFVEWTGLDGIAGDTHEMLRVYQEGGDMSLQFAQECWEKLQ